MTVTVVTPPDPVVTWEEAASHLRTESDDEKAYVEGLIAAATAWIDGPAGWLGRSIGPQLLQLDGWSSCERVPLPYGPVLEIESISTNALSDAPAPVLAADYRLHTNGSLIIPAGAAWVREPDHRIRYWAGYGKRDPQNEAEWIAEVPAPIKQAILLLVGQWFRTRSAVNVGNIVNEMPFAVEALLSPYRIWR